METFEDDAEATEDMINQEVAPIRCVYLYCV